MSAVQPSNARQASVEDVPVGTAASSTTPETPAIAERSQSASNDGTSEDESIVDYTLTEERSEIIRILRWPETAYYQILDVGENADRTQIRRAYLKRSKLVHPDRNQDLDANSASQRVNKANEILWDERTRREYDNNELKRLKDEGRLVQNDLGESFAANAFSGDNNDNGGDSDSDIDDEDSPEPISVDKANLLNRIEPVVHEYFSSPQESTYKKLKDFKKEMLALNEKENKQRVRDGKKKIWVEKHLPPVEIIKRRSQKLQNQRSNLGILSSDPQAANNLKDEIKRDLEAFKQFLSDMDLPTTWGYNISNILNSPAGPQNGARNEQTGSTPPSPEQNARDGQSSNSSTEAGISANQSLSNATNVNYIPGKTTQNGEIILAYRGIKGTLIVPDQRGEQDGIQRTGLKFVIEKKGSRNPIALVDYIKVGREAAMAYITRPEEKINVLHADRQYTKQDGRHLGKILGVAQDVIKDSAQRRPWAVVMAEFKGETRFFNRSALENMTSQRESDILINDCLIQAGELPAPRIQKQTLQLPWTDAQHSHTRPYYLENYPYRSDYPAFYDLDPHTYIPPGSNRTPGSTRRLRPRHSEPVPVRTAPSVRPDLHRRDVHSNGINRSSPREGDEMQWESTHSQPRDSGLVPVRTAPSMQHDLSRSASDSQTATTSNNQGQTNVAASDANSTPQEQQLTNRMDQMATQINQLTAMMTQLQTAVLSRQ